MALSQGFCATVSARGVTLLARRLPEVVVDDFARTQSQVPEDVDGGGQNLEHRQLRDRRQRLGMKIESTGTDPGTLQFDVFQAVSTGSQIRNVPFTSGMIFRRKFEASSEALTAARSAGAYLYPIVPVATRTGP